MDAERVENLGAVRPHALALRREDRCDRRPCMQAKCCLVDTPRHATFTQPTRRALLGMTGVQGVQTKAVSLWLFKS